MAHIANKIDAKDKKLSEILSGQRFRIDVFQREYRWERKHIEALVSDLTSSFLKCYSEGDEISDYENYDCYYMGPVVLCEYNKAVSIIDGQQRLTSFTLLLIYLDHLCKKLGISDDTTRDFNMYLYVKKGGTKTFILDIDKRKIVMEALIKGENLESLLNGTDLDASSRNMIERYEDIASLFPSEVSTMEILPIFIEWLLDKVMLVEIRAYTMDSAYTIFETMNDRGLNLSPTEILKGYLLSKIIEDHTEYEEKAENANEFWTMRINQMKSKTSSDNCDLDFFRAWLRGKYAETKRQTKVGAENEDFEEIATQFHSWVKNNTGKMGLKKNEDFYFFIKSDFNFFSNLYLRLYDYRMKYDPMFEILYVNNAYTIADSLLYPLYFSAITKVDNEDVVNRKINLIGEFIDRYTNIRALQNKSITQTSIRNNIYDIVRYIRNGSVNELSEVLEGEIRKQLSAKGTLTQLTIYNSGYMKYFLARIKYQQGRGTNEKCNFSDFLPSRRLDSYVLCRLCEEHEDIKASHNSYDVCNICLVKKADLAAVQEMRTAAERIGYLSVKGYFPETGAFNGDVEGFLQARNEALIRSSAAIWELPLEGMM